MNLQAMVYCSDHGEDMKYFHGDSTFTWSMVRTPAFVYLAPDYKKSHTAVADNLRYNENMVFTNDLIYDMVCGILVAPNNEYDRKYDITNADYGLSADKATTKYGKYLISDDVTI